MSLGAFRLSVLGLYLVSTSAVHVQAQHLVLDSTRPFVYIEFDHTGERQTSVGPEKALWLQIVNNSSIPIEVNTYSKDDSGRDLGINYSVVLTPEGRVKYIQNQGAVPLGHSQDVSSLHTVAPGEKLMFTIPASDVSRFWYIRTSVRFSLPRKMTGNDPTLNVVFTGDTEYQR